MVLEGEIPLLTPCIVFVRRTVKQNQVAEEKLLIASAYSERPRNRKAWSVTMVQDDVNIDRK